MATKTISLDEEADERLKAHTREGESFSEVVKRLAGECSWTEVAGVLSDDEADELEQVIGGSNAFRRTAYETRR